jgi:hypothetical protein
MGLCGRLELLVETEVTSSNRPSPLCASCSRALALRATHLRRSGADEVATSFAGELPSGDGDAHCCRGWGVDRRVSDPDDWRGGTGRSGASAMGNCGQLLPGEDGGQRSGRCRPSTSDAEREVGAEPPPEGDATRFARGRRFGDGSGHSDWRSAGHIAARRETLGSVAIDVRACSAAVASGSCRTRCTGLSRGLGGGLLLLLLLLLL